MMDVYIPERLATRLAPKEASTPYLTGRATRWQVAVDWWVRIDGVWYCVPAGYVFNGASIPWWLWWLFPPTYLPAWEASALHDLFYSHLYEQVSKRFADAAFKAIMLYHEAHPWIASIFHAAVRIGGRGGW